MRSVFAQADIGDHQQAVQCPVLLEGAQRPLHDSVFGPGAGGLLVLRLRQAKEQQSANPQRRSRLSLFRCLVHREVEDPRHGADLATNSLARTEKQRVNQRPGLKMGLTHQRPHGLGAPQTTQAGNREFHAPILKDAGTAVFVSLKAYG
jgi:hypothetical protein